MIEPSVFDIVVVVLGAWRITRLVVRDAFPPIARIRDWIIERHPTDDTAFLGSHVTDPDMTATFTIHGTPVLMGDDEHGMPIWFPIRDTVIGGLISCVWCIGFWIATATVAAYAWTPSWTVITLTPFALSAAIGFVDRADR